MAVEERELKCYVYINSVKDIEQFAGQGIYGLDKIRSEKHDELCMVFGITKEQTKKYTDNLDKIDFNGSELYCQLLQESRK
jgi:hypothetical protein